MPLDSRITLRLSQPLDVEQIETLTFSLMSPNGLQPVDVVFAEEGMLVFLTPQDFLLPGSVYSLTMTGAAEPKGPITVLESFAVGLPVIATNVGATPEILNDGVNGILVEPGDIDGLTTAIVRMANDHALRERIGKQGYADIQERFSAERWVKELRGIYSEVADAE